LRLNKRLFLPGSRDFGTLFGLEVLEVVAIVLLEQLHALAQGHVEVLYQIKGSCKL